MNLINFFSKGNIVMHGQQTEYINIKKSEYLETIYRLIRALLEIPNRELPKTLDGYNNDSKYSLYIF